MIEIKLTPNQNEAVYFMIGSPNFCEYNSQNFWDFREETESERKRYIKEFDSISHDNEKMILKFIPYEAVRNEMIYDLERFREIALDGLSYGSSPADKKADRELHGLRRSVSILINKIKKL
jgi:hypothetical protein